ncbi:MAG: hypothetical protein HC831_13510 [Chloroflexia bacterium]|nr:hypothetical protein [Chloroflexia bacterium]
MRDFFRTILQYIRPYKLQALLNIIFNLFGAFFSLFSLMLLIPFLGILFNSDQLILEKPAFEFSVDYANNYFNYYMSNIIVESGKINALLFVCIFVLLTVLLKNVFIYFANFYMAPIRNGIVRDIRNKIYRKVLNLHIGYFSDEKKGDVISKNDNRCPRI